MNFLGEDLNESDLFCKSIVQKRKAAENINPKHSKQLKLNFPQTSAKTKEEKQIKDSNSLQQKRREMHDWNSRCNESHSTYFLKKSINICPLCSKSFKTDPIYSAHMKQCAKTHKMTTQQLLGALELQKKQIQEQRGLGGLCLEPTSGQKKTLPRKKLEKDSESYDLALGLALSKSLIANESKPTILSDAPQSTLKEFGFTGCNTGAAVPVKRKNDGDKKLLLRERTAEDRQKIVIEKVAVVLLDEDKELNPKNKPADPKFSFQNAQVPQLWSKGENNCKSGWYVHEIKKLLLSSDNHEEELPQSVPDNIENEIAKLCLPQKDTSSDWRKLINNENFSDFVGKTKDGQDVHLHLVILYIRHPELLEKDCKSIFEKFNLSTILIFLEYLYCGTLNSLSRMEVDNLFGLARDFDYSELIEILNYLKSNLSTEVCSGIPNLSPNVEHQEKNAEITMIDNENVIALNDKNSLNEEDLVDLTQKGYESEAEEIGDSSNAEKSFWSFIQHQKKEEQEGNLEKQKETLMSMQGEEKTDLRSPGGLTEINELRRLSNNSTTKDFSDLLSEKRDKASSDCIILSSGSETKSQENFIKSPSALSRTPSPVHVNYEAPLFDPYDNFSEEPFSPVGLLSQSLITGDISVESPKENIFDGQEEPNKNIGYCSTPVTLRTSSTLGSSTKTPLTKKRKKRDLSSSRLLRKSLGLHQRRNSKSNTFKKKGKKMNKSLGETLTNAVLNELSRCSAFDSPLPRPKNFIEITPIPNREEFADAVTPSPNYSNMGEALIKEQLTKYGLKKNLAKSKAKKILRLIYDELHPLYNTETGKVVKMLPGNTPKGDKKSKKATKSKKEKIGKTKQSKSDDSGKQMKRCFSSSKESENFSDGSILSLDRSLSSGSDESDFESVTETLTQSVPTNPLDLPSAFCEFLQNHPEYHQKILLYEPIWLEELQKKLKEYFKKHFKIADLMDFLDQKCIAFRSAAQAKNIQKKNQKKKEKSKKQKMPSKENGS